MKQNEVVDLYYNRGLSTFEIAKNLKVSHSSIMRRLSTARNNIEKIEFVSLDKDLFNIEKIVSILNSYNHREGYAKYNDYAPNLEWCEDEEIQRDSDLI